MEITYMRHLPITLLLVLITLAAGPLRSQESEPTRPTAAAGSDAPAEQPSSDTDTEPERSSGGQDGFLPTERLRHDQEVDYPTDI